MKITLVLLLAILTGCARNVHTRVTSMSAPNDGLKSPLKLFWIYPEDDLLKQQQVEKCKTYFSQNASVINQSKDCDDCLSVLFNAGMGGSDTTSSPTTKYNFQTNKYDSSTDTDTEHERVVELKFMRNKKLVHQAKAVSWGSSSNIERVLPEMCHSLGKDFPQNRQAQLYKVGF
jgi:hypothetical protein